MTLELYFLDAIDLQHWYMSLALLAHKLVVQIYAMKFIRLKHSDKAYYLG